MMRASEPIRAAIWCMTDRMIAGIATAEEDSQSWSFDTVAREARRAYRKRRNR
jgi:hypothetical protein